VDPDAPITAAASRAPIGASKAPKPGKDPAKAKVAKARSGKAKKPKKR
jgi:hypothetical protein